MCHGSIFRLIQGINRSVIRQLDYINCEINVFQNSCINLVLSLPWYSLTPSPSPTERGAPNGVRLLCETEESMGFEDIVTNEHRVIVTY